MPSRILLPVAHWPGWEVGDDGSVWYDGRRRNPYVKLGYNQIHMCVSENGHEQRSTLAVGRLVLEAFVGPRPEGHEVRHGKAGKLCDRLTNLRWERRAVGKDAPLRSNVPKGYGLTGEIARLIHQRREEAKLTLADAAQIARVSRQAWVKLERGGHSLRLLTLLRVAAALGCELQELLPPKWRDRIFE